MVKNTYSFPHNIIFPTTIFFLCDFFTDALKEVHVWCFKIKKTASKSYCLHSVCYPYPWRSSECAPSVSLGKQRDLKDLVFSSGSQHLKEKQNASNYKSQILHEDEYCPEYAHTIASTLLKVYTLWLCALLPHQPEEVFHTLACNSSTAHRLFRPWKLLIALNPRSSFWHRWVLTKTDVNAWSNWLIEPLSKIFKVSTS